MNLKKYKDGLYWSKVKCVPASRLDLGVPCIDVRNVAMKAVTYVVKTGWAQ